MQRQLADLPLAPPEAVGRPEDAEVRPAPARPATATDGVAVMRHRAEDVDGRALDARVTAQFVALQRQVAQTLAQGYRADIRPAEKR